MRQIKFRGETLGGRIVYGFFCCTEVEDVTLPCIIVEEGDYRQVKPESVAQLIGIDANGREVYEGDKVIRIAGDEDFNPEKTFPMAAAFDDYAAIRDEEIVLVEAVTNEAD